MEITDTLDRNLSLEQRDDWHLTELLGHNDGRSDPFAAAVRATRMPMVITDPNQIDNPIVFANKAFQNLTGYERSEIIGRNCRFLQGPETDRQDVEKIRRATEAGESIDVDLLNYRKDGSTFWNALFVSPVRDDAGNVLFFFASQMNISERVALQDDIRRQKELIEVEVQKRTHALEESDRAKTVLLHEVDHRVKNNLTMVGSLLRLQARTISDVETKNKLNSMLERVDALATVHRRLYQSDSLETFDVGGFARTLLTDISALTGRSDIELDIRCDHVGVPSRSATSMGLVINEVLINVFKHAFPDKHPDATIRLSATKSQSEGSIVIEDNGVGYDTVSKTKGLGSTLIQRLSQQANARVLVESGKAGSRFVMTFPLETVA